MLSKASSDKDHEALAALRKAQEMLKANGLDWHSVVEAVGKAGLFKPPAPSRNAADIKRIRGMVTATLKKADRWLTDSNRKFLQQMIEDPLRYDENALVSQLTRIMNEAAAKRLAETRTKRAGRSQ
jgi:hypothetical protein